ncbi:MAG: hypothetical protein AAF467_27890 [Actinomycetota bacterium]
MSNHGTSPNLPTITERDDIIDAVRRADDAVEYLVRETFTPGSVSAPDTSTVICYLAAVARRVEQLLAQLASNLEHHQRSTTLRLDGHGQARWGNPTEAVVELSGELATWASHDAHKLAESLDSAFQIASTIGHHFDLHDGDSEHHIGEGGES